MPGLRDLYWVGGSRRAIREFPVDARRRAGFELERLQRGLAPLDFKPLPAVGPGAFEIRIHTRLEHRVIYVTSIGTAIAVLHAFEKRTRKMSRSDLELARTRYKSFRNEFGG